ncbi:hypothetical protein [Chitinophaga pinensis]|nr:hypothetical protein [Chitinophaga pinensis]
MRKLWNNPDRGAVPIGWTLSPQCWMQCREH